MKLFVALACSMLSLTGCLDGEIEDLEYPDDLVDTTEVPDDDSAAFRGGVNSGYCAASPYNCRFRKGSSRVTTQAGSEDWGIEPGASVRDGNGDVLGPETATKRIFNYGQTRYLAGKAHALLLGSSNLSAGWYPIDHILGEASFRQQMGEVNGKDPGQGKLACYSIRASHDPVLELKKVVHDSKVGPNGHERAGDYLPLVRKNGLRSANLVFSVPGFALGGATTDHFQAGTKFQRVTVPTDSGKPSISIPLWIANPGDNNRYTRRSGTMRFLYGYIKAADGVKRFGWMAQDALQVASGCP
ncbi:MAG: hypothetical protein H0T79_15875 [Deltaproteobacteria bacterium]|nr:hypothetical protein [Deltaproteobacteria bacterium]